METTLSSQALRSATVCPAELSDAVGPAGSMESWIGQHLVHVEGEAALHEAIESIAEDAGFWSLVKAQRLVMTAPPSAPQMAALWSKIGALAGAEAPFARAMDELVFLLDAIHLLQQVYPARADVLDREPLWFAYDPSIPPRVARAIVQGIYAGIALRGISYAARVSAPVQPWWKRSIVQRWAADQHEYVRLVASLPGVGAPTELVPAEERLDLLAMSRENDASNQAITALVDFCRFGQHRAVVLFPATPDAS